MNMFGFSVADLPAPPLERLLELAQETGYRGLELRSGPGETVHLDLDRAGRQQIAAAFDRAGVSLLGLVTSLDVTAPGEDGQLLAELRRHIWLAADVGARYLRVLPCGADTGGSGSGVRAERRLRAVASLAATCGVRILLQTQDAQDSVGQVAGLLDRIGAAGVGAFWDVQGSPEQGGDLPRAYARLASHLGFIQVHGNQVHGDQARQGQAHEGLGEPPAAEGTVPDATSTSAADCTAGPPELRAALRTAVDNGYDGWFVWKYDARRPPQPDGFAPALAAGRDWLERTTSASRSGRARRRSKVGANAAH